MDVRFSEIPVISHEPSVLTQRADVILRYLGYPADKVKILDGGIHAWKVQGKPIVGAEAMGTATHFSHAPKTFPQSSAGESLLIGRDEFLQIVQDTLNHSTPTILIDTRDEPEWMGKTSSPYGLDFCPRMGRIPGAHWIEWKRMMEKNEAGVAHIKNPEEVLNICGEFQIGPETPVVVFCFKGARASNTLVALQDAGVKDVRLYMGSWYVCSDHILEAKMLTSMVTGMSGLETRHFLSSRLPKECTNKEGNIDHQEYAVKLVREHH